MGKAVRLKITTKDRVGMALDILKILYCYNINLTALEVKPGIIWAKIDYKFDIDLDFLKQQILNIKDVMEVVEISSLPHEIKEKYINAVLNATKEGIIAVDKDGIITTFNQSAEKILNIKKEKALGKSISEILAPNLPILKTIKTGEIYDNKEIVLNNNNSRSHYVTSGRPILDSQGKPVGAVASLRDIESVMELVYSFTQPAMNTFDDILGKSESILRIKEMARTVAKGNSTVLLRGESGTGKELFARAIHMASPRRNKPFVAVNCAALPPTLLESELFGYEEGSFTGAKKGGKHGLFKYADKGTIFLDEIGELPTHLQVKLLRVLQEYKIRKVGSSEEIPVDVRVIAATNRNLEELIKTGQFREDLYYRLNVIPLVIPPLRERREDIPILAKHFIEKLSHKMNKKISGISDDAMKKLLNYNWPGNVRELSNVIERAINLCNDRIELGHILLKEDLRSSSYHNFEKETRTLKDLVAKTEKEAISKALSRYGSIRKTARALGVTHATIINKIKRYNITT
jgi:transcriptional regulator of aroF, aroG, tyrA and aromatic amino acid transport